MAVIAAQTIAWGTSGLMPQSQAASFPTASMYITPVQMENVAPAPYVYNLVPPATPSDAEIIAINDAVIEILVT